MSDCDLHLLTPGEIVDGRYEVIELIGEGGFAFVYRARHVHIGREVALKVLALDPRLHPTIDERFQTEATLAARLAHPHVVAIHDFGFLESPRLPYIAMALLSGHDLDDELARCGALSPARALRLTLEALEALACAHDAGIVHKDLKPSNLFINHAGTARESLVLVDFGIAGLLSGDRDDRRTATGELCGTPAYMSPEYIEGGPLTASVDVYQMALLLAEMLTGRPVVDGPTPYSALMRHCNGDLPIADWIEGSALGPVLGKALAMSPQDRYRDAAAFAEALRAIDPTTLAGPTHGATAPEPSAERPARLTLEASMLPPPPLVQTATEDGIARPEHTSRSASRWVPLAWAALAIVVLAVTWSLLLGGESGLEPSLDAQASTGDLPDDRAAEASASLVRVEIVSTPPMAEVLRDGAPLGRTPLRIEVAPDTPQLQLELRAEGHASRTVTVDPATQPRVEVRLDALPVSRLPRVIEAPPVALPADDDEIVFEPQTPAPARSRPRNRRPSTSEFTVIE